MFTKNYGVQWGHILLMHGIIAARGVTAPLHQESIIVFLPKEGKDPGDSKNLRPVTLTNCDLKIITKALSNRMSKVR